MNQLIAWAAMGGYALYVWPVYGLAILLIGLHVFSLKRQRWRSYKKLQQWFKRLQ